MLDNFAEDHRIDCEIREDCEIITEFKLYRGLTLSDIGNHWKTNT